jgi:hypothetical protein
VYSVSDLKLFYTAFPFFDLCCSLISLLRRRDFLVSGAEENSENPLYRHPSQQQSSGDAALRSALLCVPSELKSIITTTSLAGGTLPLLSHSWQEVQFKLQVDTPREICIPSAVERLHRKEPENHKQTSRWTIPFESGSPFDLIGRLPFQVDLGLGSIASWAPIASLPLH